MFNRHLMSKRLADVARPLLEAEARELASRQGLSDAEFLAEQEHLTAFAEVVELLATLLLNERSRSPVGPLAKQALTTVISAAETERRLLQAAVQRAADDRKAMEDLLVALAHQLRRFEASPKMAIRANELALLIETSKAGFVDTNFRANIAQEVSELLVRSDRPTYAAGEEVRREVAELAKKLQENVEQTRAVQDFQERLEQVFSPLPFKGNLAKLDHPIRHLARVVERLGAPPPHTTLVERNRWGMVAALTIARDLSTHFDVYNQDDGRKDRRLLTEQSAAFYRSPSVDGIMRLYDRLSDFEAAEGNVIADTCRAVFRATNSGQAAKILDNALDDAGLTKTYGAWDCLKLPDVAVVDEGIRTREQFYECLCLILGKDELPKAVR